MAASSKVSFSFLLFAEVMQKKKQDFFGKLLRGVGGGGVYTTQNNKTMLARGALRQCITDEYHTHETICIMCFMLQYIYFTVSVVSYM